MLCDTRQIKAYLILCCGFLLFASSVQCDELRGYYTRITPDRDHVTDYEDLLSGEFADVIIQFEDGGQVVFRRTSSYLPRWETGSGTYFFDEIVSRSGDGNEEWPDEWPDTYNRYSYARIIENEPEKVVVHWRYMANFENVEWDGVVDEYFTVRPDGIVERTIRQGTKKLDEWNDPTNTIVQKLQLTKSGIKEESRGRLDGQSKVPEKVKDAPIRKGLVIQPVIQFSFDEGLDDGGDKVLEVISKTDYEVEGPKTVWRTGVSGTALGFDGYSSGIRVPSATFKGDELTVEAWVALGAYPFDWSPLVHQSTWGKEGFYLGINADGLPGFHVAIGSEWQACIANQDNSLPLRTWCHVMGVFDGKSLRLFVDGEPIAESKVQAGKITECKEPLIIGLNKDLMPVTQRRRGRQIRKWPTILGIDGLIDEVKIYSKALTRNVADNFPMTFGISNEAKTNPDLQPRRFPGNPNGKPAPAFGARYAKLKYHELWDNQWRVSDHPDIIVDFDKLPTRIVAWRGASCGPYLVTDKGIWVGDQSSENYRPKDNPNVASGCCEFMSDKQCRHSHLRLIENSPARVMIHWRYGLVDDHYRFVKTNSGAGDWADEYWSIYPDGVAIRHLARGKIWLDSWVETMFLSQPGTRPEDNVELEAYTLVNRKGESKTYSWADGSPVADLPNPTIAMVNAKSEYRTFNVYPTGSHIDVFSGGGRRSPFHWWNHWPAGQLNTDGRGARKPDRAAHSSLVWGLPSEDVLLYGFTNGPATELQALARSWNTPPYVTNTKGCSSIGYSKDERAYHFVRLADSMSFELVGTEERPIVNPCFVISNWPNQKVSAHTVIKGNENADTRSGIVINTDGEFNAVVWVELKAEKSKKFTIEVANQN